MQVFVIDAVHFQVTKQFGNAGVFALAVVVVYQLVAIVSQAQRIAPRSAGSSLSGCCNCRRSCFCPRTIVTPASSRTGSLARL